MSKILKLNPDPTFEKTVQISLPDGSIGEIGIEFNHLGKKAWEKIISELKESDDFDLNVVLRLVKNWNLNEPFNRENVAKLLDNYPRAGGEIIEIWGNSIFGEREKN